MDRVTYTDGVDYWEDERCNAWRCDKHTQDEAQEISCRMEGCERCIDCEDCEDCQDCEGCVRCERCIDCEACVGCVGCVRCRYCAHCLSCQACVTCISVCTSGGCVGIICSSCETDAHADRGIGLIEC